MDPFGRSGGDNAYNCCDNYMNPSVNPRHLWSGHDSTRWYADPEGWDVHERSCLRCSPNEDD